MTFKKIHKCDGLVEIIKVMNVPKLTLFLCAFTIHNEQIHTKNNSLHERIEKKGGKKYGDT